MSNRAADRSLTTEYFAGRFRAKIQKGGLERDRLSYLTDDSGALHARLVDGMAADTVQSTPSASDSAIRRAVELLVSAYEPEQVYLFGSVARGDAGPDSDYDLLLVVPDDAPPEKHRSRLAYQALRGTGIAADVLVCGASWFNERRELKASLPGAVLREGILLHGSR